MKRLYLDVDGILLRKTGLIATLAPGAMEFLDFALANFECYWLTTHCRGDASMVLRYLRPYVPADTMEKLRQIRPTNFQALRTEALEGDYVWLEDSPLAAEMTELCRRREFGRWIEVNVRIRPDDLEHAIDELRSRLTQPEHRDVRGFLRQAMAITIATVLGLNTMTNPTARAAEPDKPVPTETKMAAFTGKQSQWEGFDRYDFQFNGHAAIVVVPKEPRPGRPWAWRGEFFGAFANADAALVGKGFHLVYLQVPDLFGSPAAVKEWDAFYAELTGKYGLSRKTTLIGLSRGGLYCYNWAVKNPDKVACIYADAAVCDFKSWPGGKPKGLGKGNGSDAEWAKMLKAFGFKNDAEALAYTGNPVDSLKPLADAKVPLLHVYGDADDVVPWEENTGVIAKRYKELGGSITLIAKPGVNHHPHGLKDPTPIVEFVLKCTE